VKQSLRLKLDSELTEEKRLQLKTELAEALHQKAVTEAADNFYIFVKLLAHLCLDGSNFKDGAHIRAIAASLEDIEVGAEERLMLALPPGSMKSVLIQMFSAWCLGRHPTWRIMYISHTASKAEDSSGRVRDFIRTPEYQEIFPHIRLRDDKSGVTGWGLVSGGSFKPAGAGSSIAGFRFDLGIVDDPLSEQTAQSTKERESVNDWWARGFRSRKLPHSRIVVIATRWHTRDLSGYLLDKAARNPRVDQWKLISVPAILDAAGAAYLNLPENESYWPEFLTLADLEQTRETFPRADWASLYLQSPTGEAGIIFNKDDFQDWEWPEAPECDEVIQTYDTAFSTKSTADYSVIQTWGIFHQTVENEDGDDVDEANAVLLHMDRGRWTYPELRAKAKELNARFKPDRIIVENKASGQSLVQDLKLAKLPVLPFQPESDKVSRANATSIIVEKGRVWLPMTKKYAAELLQELLEFPKGAHDDAVDAFVMAMLYLRRRYELSQDLGKKVEERRKPARRSYWKAATSK